MKAAAAVLGASLLFFLGVMTGAGRRESVPPPVAIPLGVVEQSSDGSAPPASADQPQGTTPTTPTAAPSSGSGTPAAPARPSSPTPDPSASPGPPVSPGTPRTPPATAAPPSDSSTTPTSAGPGQVKKVENEVDCSRKGKGNRESCPPTSATTERDGDRPGGGRDR